MIVGPDGKTYFARVGQLFYDGTLIAMDNGTLTFRIADKNPFSATTVREVTLAMHPMASDAK